MPTLETPLDRFRARAARLLNLDLEQVKALEHRDLLQKLANVIMENPYGARSQRIRFLMIDYLLDKGDRNATHIERNAN